MEPSLDFPPVYRQMLAGGPERLRLSRWGVGFLLGGGAALAAMSAVHALLTGDGFDASSVSSIVGAIVAAWLTGLIAARWLGNGLATLAGLIYLGGAATRLGAVDGLWTVVALAAVGLFAWGTVPGRLPVDARRGVGLVFYIMLAAAMIVAGPIGAGAILLSCVVMVLASENTRALGFFVRLLGMAILVASPAVWWAARWVGVPGAWDGNWLPPVANAGLPPDLPGSIPIPVPMVILIWAPFAGVALIIGLRQGHLTAPFWRFVACWIVVPVALAIAGILAPSAAADMFLPPLAIVVASGVHGCSVACRRLCRARFP